MERYVLASIAYTPTLIYTVTALSAVKQRGLVVVPSTLLVTIQRMKVKGEENITIYRPKIQNPEDPEPIQSEGERCSCRHCDSLLWVYDPSYPELMHPFASAIDTDLPKLPEHTRIMLDFAASWVEVPEVRGDFYHQRYPDESIAQWHERVGLVDETKE